MPGPYAAVVGVDLKPRLLFAAIVHRDFQPDFILWTVRQAEGGERNRQPGTPAVFLHAIHRLHSRNRFAAERIIAAHAVDGNLFAAVFREGGEEELVVELLEEAGHHPVRAGADEEFDRVALPDIGAVAGIPAGLVVGDAEIEQQELPVPRRRPADEEFALVDSRRVHLVPLHARRVEGGGRVGGEAAFAFAPANDSAPLAAVAGQLPFHGGAQPDQVDRIFGQRERELPVADFKLFGIADDVGSSQPVAIGAEEDSLLGAVGVERRHAPPVRKAEEHRADIAADIEVAEVIAPFQQPGSGRIGGQHRFRGEVAPDETEKVLLFGGILLRLAHAVGHDRLDVFGEHDERGTRHVGGLLVFSVGHRPLRRSRPADFGDVERQVVPELVAQQPMVVADAFAQLRPLRAGLEVGAVPWTKVSIRVKVSLTFARYSFRS